MILLDFSMSFFPNALCNSKELKSLLIPIFFSYGELFDNPSGLVQRFQMGDYAQILPQLHCDTALV